MALNSVDIRVLDQNLIGLSGVTVRIFDSSNVLQASGTTSAGPTPALGVFQTTLNGTTTPGIFYTVRLNRANTGFGNSSQIGVIDSATNQFTIHGISFTEPVSTDPNKCRVFGFLRSVLGDSLREREITIINKFVPQIVNDAGTQHILLGQEVRLSTDRTGFIQFDLYRTAVVDFVIPSQNANPYNADGFSTIFSVTVPDQANVNLADLLYPVPDTLEFIDTSPLVVAIGDTEHIDVTLTDTLNNELENLVKIKLLSSDTTKVTVVKNGLGIDITRLTAGTVFITAELDLDVVKVQHLPPKQLTFIVNTIEDTNGFEVS